MCRGPDSRGLGPTGQVGVASTVAISHFHTLIADGHQPGAALTGGLQWAIWVCGLTGLAAIPVRFALIRRRDLARAVANSSPENVPDLAASTL
jgi:hypothetical protein